MKLLDQERALLREIQRDATLSTSELAERAGMSQSTAWRKLNEFEAAGIIERRVALLNPDRLGCALCVIATISLNDHAQSTVDGFVEIVLRHAEIVECLAMSGAADYRMKIRVSDVAAYEEFMTRTLLRSGFVREIHSSFALKEIKSTTELPI